ncbi:hypothetical protein [Thiomonas sp.]
MWREKENTFQQRTSNILLREIALLVLVVSLIVIVLGIIIYLIDHFIFGTSWAHFLEAFFVTGNCQWILRK